MFGVHFAGGSPRRSRGTRSAVSINMITDYFFTDPSLVAEVKEAAARNASPSEIYKILERAPSKKPD